MNKRIQELAESAFQPINDIASEGIADRHTFEQAWFQEYNQRFAELIVQECLKTCTDVENEALQNQEYKAGSAATLIKVLIKEHFGVEA